MEPQLSLPTAATSLSRHPNNTVVVRESQTKTHGRALAAGKLLLLTTALDLGGSGGETPQKVLAKHV